MHKLKSVSSTEGGSMRGRLFLTLALGCLMLVSGVAVAFASPDTAGQEATTVIGADGASRWWYQDIQDTAGKTEGGYAAFDGTGIYLANPHGGYDSTSNKCKVCHAVHRAEGAYYLLRADSQDDACSYCHTDDSPRSRKIVYDSNDAGIYATNGHTIGASSIIPDSSVRQWLTDTTISTVDANMVEISTTVQVRRYEERRNAMFRITRGNHGHEASHISAFADWVRVGPTALSCMSCHQVHNARNLVWTPTGAPQGYKLLRASPSGSVDGAAAAAMTGRTALAAVSPADVVSVPTTNLTAANTGGTNTIWTTWRGSTRDLPTIANNSPSRIMGPEALSVWCADCHNLNVGYFQAVEPQFGNMSHADRTHPAPFVGAGTGPGQCYSCHRADMPLTAGASHTQCQQCHFSPEAYRQVRIDAEAAGDWAAFDFPHAGPANDYKMLGRWTASIEPTIGMVASQVATLNADNLDAVCRRCHTGIGTNH